MIREKPILVERIGSARMFYKSNFPALFQTCFAQKKALETSIYPNRYDIVFPLEPFILSRQLLE